MATPDTELHRNRRKAILAEFPQVSALQGVDSRTQFYAYGIFLLQVIMAWIASGSWTTAIILGVTVSPYVALCIFSLIHEISHGLVWRSREANRLLGIFANIPLLIPVSEVFLQHHMAHHLNLGSDAMDVDIPSSTEVKIVGNSTIRKALWLMGQIVILPARSTMKIPVKWDGFAALNYLLCLSIALALLLTVPQAFLYLILGLIFSQSLHPANARQVQRHVMVEQKNDRPDQAGCNSNASCNNTNGANKQLEHQKLNTYSYYGWMNAWTLNVGYHVEHHDFMNIPWVNLPELRRIAGEKWYPTEAGYKTRGSQHLWHFVFNPRISLADFGGKSGSKD